MFVLPDREALLEFDLRLTLQAFELNAQAVIGHAGVTGLFGPSGSGKSSLLRAIAGLEATANGVVRFADQAWLDSKSGINVAAYRRPVAYVFQDARLFTHLDVRGNLQFAVTRNHGAGPRFEEVVDALDLEALLARHVDKLSGGERQRVALGRSLLCNPRLLLLDEPLAALDSARKRDILPYLESLHSRFSLPTIYVSHSIDEIVRLADEVLVLDSGRVVAHGETRTVLNSLGTHTDDRQFEESSVLEGVVTRQLSDLRLTELQVGRQTMVVPARPALAKGARTLLRVRAGDVALATSEPHGISIRNVLRGAVSRIASDPAQPFAIVHVDVDGADLRCQLTRQAILELQLQTGTPVFALLKTASFDAQD